MSAVVRGYVFQVLWWPHATYHLGAKGGERMGGENWGDREEEKGHLSRLDLYSIQHPFEEFPGGSMGYGSGTVAAVAWVIAVARVRSLARELLHGTGMAKKKRGRTKAPGRWTTLSHTKCFTAFIHPPLMLEMFRHLLWQSLLFHTVTHSIFSDF